MTTVPYQPDLRLGVREMDVEHALQGALVDALDQAIRDAGDQAKIHALLTQFVDYTNTHFRTEQMLMRLQGYPLFEAHVQEHDDLLAQIRELQVGLEAGDTILSLEALDHIRAWHVLHVRGMDRTLADFLLLHRPQAAPPAPPGAS